MITQEWRETDEWETDTDAEDEDDNATDSTQYEEIEEWVLRELDPMENRGEGGNLGVPVPETDADGFTPRFENEAQRLHYEMLYVQFMLERGRRMLELIFTTPAGETVLNGEVRVHECATKCALQ